ncbi:MAG TPA: PqqD family protein [Terriglobales bacterium]|nr:PqqD family protein [Terriglobales bacterium]
MEHNSLNERAFISDHYIARSSAIAARLVGGEMMIMSAVDSTFFTLNQVGTAIWQAADGRTPLSEIITRTICAEFDVGHVQAQTDAEQFVKDLAEHGILRISDQPIIEASPLPPIPA